MKYRNDYYYSPASRRPVSAQKPHRSLRSRVFFPLGIFLLVASVGVAINATSGGQSVVAKSTQSVTVSGKTVSASLSPIKTTLPQALAGAMSGKTGNVDVAVYDSKTGQTIHYTNASGTYNTASIMKLSILEELLIQDQANGTGITNDQLSYATPMIENSDNDAATELWDEVGEGTTMQSFLNQVGASSSSVNPAGHWGLTQTTALDQLKILNQFAYPTDSSLLTSASDGTITSLLSNVESDQAWGVSGGVPSSATVLLKDGWLDDTDGWDVNSIGHVTNGSTDYAIAILTDNNTTEQTGIDTIEALSAIVYSALASS